MENTFVRARRRWEDNTGFKDPDRGQWLALMNMVMNLRFHKRPEIS
jgi:hypothetical protein